MTKNSGQKTDEENFQAKYVEYNLYKGQIQGLSEELATIGATNHALATAAETLENFDKIKESPEILVPIGAQTFATAKMTTTKEVFVNIGAGVILKKDVPAALETVKAQQKELEEARLEIESQLRTISEKMELLEPELTDIGNKLKVKQQ